MCLQTGLSNLRPLRLSKKIKLRFTLYTCAPISELPSRITVLILKEDDTLSGSKIKDHFAVELIDLVTNHGQGEVNIEWLLRIKLVCIASKLPAVRKTQPITIRNRLQPSSTIHVNFLRC